MVEWRPFGTPVRPVPEPLATPYVWAAACTGAFVLSLFGKVATPSAFLAGLSLLAAFLGLAGRFTAAPGTAVLCWLFLNGFGIRPYGRLSWEGHPDALRLTCLLTVALLGTLTARLIHARAAHRRLQPPRR